MQINRYRLIKSLGIYEEKQSFAYQFIEQAKTNYYHISHLWQEKAGIYMFASRKRVFYIGYSRNIKNRLGGHAKIRQKIESLIKPDEKECLIYVMFFDKDNLIGQVYADHHTSNYHESILINSLNPCLNIKSPPFVYGFQEEFYYRKLILEKGCISGFSTWLINSLYKYSYLKWNYDKYIFKYDELKKIVDDSIKIIQSSYAEYSQLTNMLKNYEIMES